ncbi:MAG: rhodanese-like domain-containing protein [Thiohalomonadales bacterium]
MRVDFALISNIRPIIVCITIFASGLYSISVIAIDVKISPSIASVPVHDGDDLIMIERIQDQTNVLSGGYTKTSRKCPPFCVQPLHVAPGVTTVGELELLGFIENKLEVGSGVMIDARTPVWHEKGTIPGSINIPFTEFDAHKPVKELEKTLRLLNVSKKTTKDNIYWSRLKEFFGYDVGAAGMGNWDFSKAKDVLLWCNGMWCGQSPRAIRNLLKLGYPAKKIYYYRGGMQSWQLLGLTVRIPE